MKQFSKYVGLDVHKETIAVSVAEANGGEVRYLGEIGEPTTLAKSLVMVEAAWTYRHPARKTTVLQKRAERAPEAVQEIAWKAQTRLCARYRLFEAGGKLKVQACTATARELTGFIWAIGQTLPQPTANA